jgi:hypothetical protein
MVASLVCAPRNRAVSEVVYELYSAIRPLQDRLTTAANKLGLPPGDCSTQRRANAINTVSERRIGVVLCYFANGKAVREWTNESLRVYAKATAVDGDDDALQKFWEVAGPANYNGRKPFPDPYEIRLRTYVEAEFSSTCQREENLPRGALAAIRCEPLRRAESVVYVDFPTVKLLGDYYDSRTRFPKIVAVMERITFAAGAFAT